MGEETIFKSTQEQAVASWINYLNQVRLNELLDALKRQDVNFLKAMKELDLNLATIKEDIIAKNRGAEKGMHGFIAEVAECGISKARELIKGNSIKYEWINNNGADDLVREGIYIQQKFVNAGGHFSLGAVREHFEKYPTYIADGKVYQIPKDHYAKIKELYEMPVEVANKLPTSSEFSLKKWQEVHDFFEKGDIPFDKLEPSKLEYGDVQKNTIERTFQHEKEQIIEKDKELREASYQKSKPTFKEGLKVTLAAGVIEGGTEFCMEIYKKKKSGKKLAEFDSDDWKDIFTSAGIGTAKGSIRGGSLYLLSNYALTPAAVANALVTASFGVAEQTYLFKQGKISEIEYIENSEMLCMDASVSALASIIGQVAIPIPVLGAIIGNTIGTVIYQVCKGKLSAHEEKILLEYAEQLKELDVKLEAEYQEYVSMLKHNMEEYLIILENAFSIDANEAFEGSIKLAELMGVNADDILNDYEDISNYFLN